MFDHFEVTSINFDKKETRELLMITYSCGGHLNVVLATTQIIKSTIINRHAALCERKVWDMR